MNGGWQTLALDSLGVLRVRGADTVAFLQGQLSNDVSLLAPERSLLAGYHNPQGRVIALLRLVTLAPQEVLMIVPRELAAAVSSRLAKFILRSKVQLSDDSTQWRIHGVFGSPDARQAPAGWPLMANAATPIGAARLVCVGGAPLRWLALSPVSAAAAIEVLPGARAATAEDWLRLMVGAGEPQVCAATSEEFVAQMLNLDLLGAIAFDKGCYTGQEVIARAHYRGRVKRRLQRFLTQAAAELRAGDAGELEDGRSFKVVQAVAHADGRCEFLAVTTFGAAEAAADPPGGTPPRAASVVRAAQLALPYRLPE